MRHPKKLTQLRQKVESLDRKLIGILKERFKVTEAIQKLKKASNLPLTQKKREKVLLNRYERLAKAKRLNPIMLHKLFLLLFSYSKKNGIIKRN